VTGGPDYRALAKLALDVLFDAPARPQKLTCQVRSSIVREIQAEADRQGIDWRKHHRHTQKGSEA